MFVRFSRRVDVGMPGMLQFHPIDPKDVAAVSFGGSRRLLAWLLGGQTEGSDIQQPAQKSSDKALLAIGGLSGGFRDLRLGNQFFQC